MPELSETEVLNAFDCPRCGNAANERFFGPCSSCRDELAATLHHAPRDVAVEGYEPKMNVTPNHVATKE